MLTVVKRSAFSGTMNEMELPITLDRLERWEQSGQLVQDAFPDLTADQREFLISGMLPDEWDDAYGEEQWDDIDLGDEPAF